MANADLPEGAEGREAPPGGWGPMNGLQVPVWYSKPFSGEKSKALLFDTRGGYATIALESGRFATDRIEYVALGDAAGLFGRYEWAGAGGRTAGKAGLEPCPFCGAATPGVDRERVGGGISAVWVSCPGCMAQGPLACDEEAAKSLWNSRCGRRGGEVGE